MNADERDRLRGIVADQLGVRDPSEIVSDTNLAKLGMESMDEIELAMEIEDKFDIELADDAMDRVLTFGDLVQLIANLKPSA